MKRAGAASWPRSSNRSKESSMSISPNRSSPPHYAGAPTSAALGSSYPPHHPPSPHHHHHPYAPPYQYHNHHPQFHSHNTNTHYAPGGRGEQEGKRSRRSDHNRSTKRDGVPREDDDDDDDAEDISFDGGVFWNADIHREFVQAIFNEGMKRKVVLSNSGLSNTCVVKRYIYISVY